MYPKYAQVGENKYEINTDFRVAMKCFQVIDDKEIEDDERAMAILYLLFGEKGMKSKDRKALIDKARIYLQCGKESGDLGDNEEPDMDLIEDYSYIKTSFRSDYGIKLDEEKDMHWWEFNELLNGLSNSELGDCCVLNRIRNLRNYDTKDIKDYKEKERIEKAKESVALKKYKRENNLTQEQEESMKKLDEIIFRR